MLSLGQSQKRPHFRILLPLQGGDRRASECPQCGAIILFITPVPAQSPGPRGLTAPPSTLKATLCCRLLGGLCVSAGWWVVFNIVSACLLRLERALRQLLAGTQGPGPPSPWQATGTKPSCLGGAPSVWSTPPPRCYLFIH